MLVGKNIVAEGHSLEGVVGPDLMIKRDHKFLHRQFHHLMDSLRTRIIRYYFNLSLSRILELALSSISMECMKHELVFIEVGTFSWAHIT